MHSTWIMNRRSGWSGLNLGWVCVPLLGPLSSGSLVRRLVCANADAWNFYIASNNDVPPVDCLGGHCVSSSCVRLITPGRRRLISNSHRSRCTSFCTCTRLAHANRSK
jgi:hypothetical protein